MAAYREGPLRTLLIGLLIAAASLLGACASEEGGDITGTTWRLVSLETQTPQFSAIVPAAAMVNYTIEFNDDGTFSAKADCNQVSGDYTIQGEGVLTITPGASTMAECGEQSLSAEYVAALGQAGSFTIAENQLTITLLDDGTLTFTSA
jgi:heat shock protein HslJ